MSVDTDYAVLREVLERYAPSGWAAEFGVYSGYSLSLIAAHMPVIGFDSFEGLPEDWREGFYRGMFDIGGKPTFIPPYNSMLVQGWFEDTAPGFPFPKLSLVHIDCDLYSSTVTALEAVEPYIGHGTIIVFDEFHGYPGWQDHEAKAWEEFVMKHRVIYMTIAEGEQETAFMISHVGEHS